MGGPTLASRAINYRGPVKNFTHVIEVSSLVWFLATLLLAKRFLRLWKHESRQDSYRIFSLRPQTFVACLCFMELAHALSAHISNSITPISLIFTSTEPATWAMKLAFLSTAITTFMCQSYIVQIGYELYNRKKIFLYATMPFVIIAFVQSVVTIFAGQAYAKWPSLGFYFSIVAVAAGTSNTCDMAMTVIMALFPLKLLPGNINGKIYLIFRLLGGFLALDALIISATTFVYGLHISDHVIWAYADMAGYEVIGNSYPVLIIWLMCMPGFGTWDEGDDSTKVPLLQAV